MTRAQEAGIRLHGERLQAIFPAAAGFGPVELCRKLRRLELEANGRACRLCNGEIEQPAYDSQQAKVLTRLDKLLGFRKLGIPVFVNGDPRGYALKIDDAWIKAHNATIHRDMGGYGIIAPEIGADGF